MDGGFRELWVACLGWSTQFEFEQAAHGAGVDVDDGLSRVGHVGQVEGGDEVVAVEMGRRRDVGEDAGEVVEAQVGVVRCRVRGGGGVRRGAGK